MNRHERRKLKAGINGKAVAVERVRGPHLVRAQLVQDEEHIQLPGQYIWRCTSATSTGPSAIQFMCPCGCQKMSILVLDCEQTADDPQPKWKWNGDLEKPSLEQPIEKHEGCYWHGNLVGGMFVVRG